MGKDKGVGITRGEGNKTCPFPLLLMVAVPIIPPFILPNWQYICNAEINKLVVILGRHSNNESIRTILKYRKFPSSIY